MKDLGEEQENVHPYQSIRSPAIVLSPSFVVFDIFPIFQIFSYSFPQKRDIKQVPIHSHLIRVYLNIRIHFL